MSSNEQPVKLPGGRVTYVNIDDDVESSDINPQVKLDRFGMVDEAKYCGCECEVKDEVKDDSYNDSCQTKNFVKVEELADFKMEVEGGEIDSLGKEVKKSTTCTSDIKEERSPTPKSSDIGLESIEISSEDDEEFKGFGFPPSPTKKNDGVNPLSNSIQKTKASFGNTNRYRGHPVLKKNQETVDLTGSTSKPRYILPKPTFLAQEQTIGRPLISSTPPQKETYNEAVSPNNQSRNRKTIATSPFKEIEASFGTNPLILLDDDESADSDLPKIVSTTSIIPPQKSVPAPSYEMMIVDDNPPTSIPPSIPDLVPLHSIMLKTRVKRTTKRTTSTSKILRLHEACCLIDKLSKRKFMSDAWWSDEERIQILQNGKPSINYERIFEFSIHGQTMINFQTLKWLTGCVERKRLYCWICLLFCGNGSWKVNASQGLELLAQALQIHSESQDHRLSEIRESRWMKRNLKDRYYHNKPKLTVQDPESLLTLPNKPTNSSSITPNSGIDEEKSRENPEKTMAGVIHSYASMGMKPNNDHQKPCLIRMLLKNNFVSGTWMEGEQDEIVTQGRRCPSMEYVFGGSIVNGYAETIFTDNLYVKYPWLTASWERKTLYCWPCVLYNTENSCLELSESPLSAVFDNHETLNSHLESSLCLKLLEHDIKIRSMKGKVEQDQETVKKKRDFLKHLIDVVCITKPTLKNSGSSEEDYAELLKLIASYNLNLEGFLHETSSATGKDAATYLVSNHAEGILTAINHVMMKKIKREVQRSPFVSIMLDDVKGLINKSFVSVIMRYVKENGDVHERFVKFIEVGYNRTSGNMIRQVMAVVSEMECESRLVGFTYDGAVIEPTDVRKFNAEMGGLCTSALFFHNRNHNLKFLIQQALSHLKECRHFFQHLVPLMNFFNSTPAAINELIELDCKTAGESNTHVWDFSIEFISTIHHHYPAMLELFEKIIRQPNDWDIEHVVHAPYYRGFLQNQQNRFFIVFLSEVFSVVGDLAEALQRDFDVEHWKCTLHATKTKLQQMDTKFEHICRIACSETLLDTRASEAQVESIKELNKELYGNLLTCIINFISNRTENIDNLKFFDRDIISSIVNKSRDGTKDIVARLTTTYCPMFSPLYNITKLKAQLDFHFGHKCFKPIKSINELMKDMHEYEMNSTMAELHKLMRLILTIPIASNFIEKTKSYEKMASYVKDNIHNLSTINAFMWMEKDLLESLQEEEDFYERVIAYFAKKPGNEQFRLPSTTKNK